MNVLIKLTQDNLADEYQKALIKHFGKDCEHYHLLLTRSSLPADAIIDFDDFFEKLKSVQPAFAQEEFDDDEELCAMLQLDEDYAPVYNALTDQLIYDVVFHDEFNVPVEIFVKWIKGAWKRDYQGLVHAK